MKATGEVMAIDRTFEAALQKAVRSLELGARSILWEHPDWDEAIPTPILATDDRLWLLLAALRRGVDPLQLARDSAVDPWFLERLGRIVAMERRLLSEELTPALLRQAKRLGFSDANIGTLADRLPDQVRALREQWGLRPVYKMVDTCAAEFDAVTPYFYSTYEEENDAPPDLDRERMLVIGSGPIRIGQGIEFDYCSVQAAHALQAAGVQSILTNSNPETVSTDFDTSDRLYFEPLDEEAIRDLLENEAGDGEAPPSIVQFGGQTAVNLARDLQLAALPIAGSSAEAIDLAEDRGRFEQLVSQLGVPQPPGTAVETLEQALPTADTIGYPVLVRPSYVLGGRAMEVVQDANELVRYFEAALEERSGPILIDKYLEGLEVEVDAVCDGASVLIPGIMEHVERAGVHSGDSMAVYPPQSLSPEQRDAVVDYTTRMALALGVYGLMNVQYVVAPDADPEGLGVFVIEVNPRSSRTVPFISKVTGVPLVSLAVNVMLGRSLAEQGYDGGLVPDRDLVAVKAPVFSMSKLIGVDTFLGPEMKSTGEVMGVDHDFEAAMRKAAIAADLAVTPKTPFLLSLANPHQVRVRPPNPRPPPGRFAALRHRGHRSPRARPRPACRVRHQAPLGRPPERRRRHQRRHRRRRHQHHRGWPRIPPPRRVPHPSRRHRDAHPLLHLARHRARLDPGAHQARLLPGAPPRALPRRAPRMTVGTLDAVLFDLDGTLADSMTSIAAALVETLGEHGHHTTVEELMPNFGPSMQHVIRHVTAVDAAEAERLYQTYLTNYYDHYMPRTPPIPGAERPSRGTRCAPPARHRHLEDRGRRALLARAPRLGGPLRCRRRPRQQPRDEAVPAAGPARARRPCGPPRPRRLRRRHRGGHAGGPRRRRRYPPWPHQHPGCGAAPRGRRYAHLP